jgi:hypothetical protein
MNPAPTMTTWLPAGTSAMTLRASSRVQNECTPGPSAPGMGGRAAREPVAMRQSSYSTVEASSRDSTFLAVSSDAALRPSRALTFHAASEAAVAVKTCDSAMVLPR